MLTSGGELLARKDLIEIAKCYIKTLQYNNYITTNGSLPERIEKLKEISFFHRTELCFQFIDDFPDNHNKVRKINYF